MLLGLRLLHPAKIEIEPGSKPLLASAQRIHFGTWRQTWKTLVSAQRYSFQHQTQFSHASLVFFFSYIL